MVCMMLYLKVNLLVIECMFSIGFLLCVLCSRS